MKWIDKIFASYYTFYARPGKVMSSKPEGYTTYVFTFGVLLWLMIIDAAVNYYVYNKTDLSVGGSNGITTIFIGLVTSSIVYYLFYRRYIKTSLYLKLNEQYKNEVQNKSFWRFISILYIFFPLLLFLALAIIWHKN